MEENERIEDRVVVKVLGFEVRVKIRLIRAAEPEDAIGVALKLSEESLELEECDQRVRECHKQRGI